MADSAVAITAGSGTNIDTRTEATNGNHRQVVILGDPSVNDNIVSVVTADPGASSTAGGIVVRVAGSITVQQINASASVHIASTGGTLIVKLDPAGTAFVNAAHTASIFTVSGSTSTAGNNTLVAPSASYNFKVFAYSIATTGVVSITPRFTTGASAGATELWRPLITSASSSSAPVGANLAVAAPGFLFATGTNTTLSLYLDTGTLTHYSVSYIKESA